VDEDEEVLGDGADCPATNCLDVLNHRPSAADGVYWIDVSGTTFDVLCDMTDDGGGWTLVANFVWPGNTSGVSGWTSGSQVGTTTSDSTQSFKLSDTDMQSLATTAWRGHGTATQCYYAGGYVAACASDLTLFWSATCAYASGSTSSGACAQAYDDAALSSPRPYTSPCAWHYGLTSIVCGSVGEMITSHSGDQVSVGILDAYTHAYSGRSGEDPNIEVWAR
jgi:hypothetical protein